MSVLERAAWLKMMLHAHTHSTVAVGGFLLGTQSPSGELVVVDAVPVYHHTPSPPMVAACLDMVNVWAETRSLDVVGLYHANQAPTDKVPPVYLARIAASVGDGIKLVMLSGELLDTAPLSCWTLMRQRGEGWEEDGSGLPPDAATCGLPALLTAMKSASTSLVDFDDHLDDVTKDWRNPWCGSD